MTDETLPEPDGYGSLTSCEKCQNYPAPLYTAATLREAVKRARREALEEAANLCDLEVIRLKEDAKRIQLMSHTFLTYAVEAAVCADAIRNLAAIDEARSKESTNG